MLTKNQKNYQIARELTKTSPKEYLLSFLNLLKWAFSGGILAYLLHALSGETFWTKSLTDYNDGNTYLFDNRWKAFEIEIFNLSWIGDIADFLSQQWKDNIYSNNQI